MTRVVYRDGGDNVQARRTIPQSPLADAPAVPRGAVGHIEDEADDLYWVDFGTPYGTVACDADDLEGADEPLDWLCTRCQTVNGHADRHCVNCGWRDAALGDREGGAR